ncbi:MAG TPA: hypothetical protein VIJ71_10280 [Mycobacteriales bacterium]
MAGTTHAPMAAWVAVTMMIVGFTMCTGAFIWHNNIPLWILGGVVGAIGLILGRVYHVIDNHEELSPPQGEHL